MHTSTQLMAKRTYSATRIKVCWQPYSMLPSSNLFSLILHIFASLLIFKIQMHTSTQLISILQPEFKSVGSYILCFYHQIFSLSISISKYPNSLLHYIQMHTSTQLISILQPELKSVGSHILCFHHQIFSLSISISKYSNSLLHYLSLKYKYTYPPNL